MDLAESEGSNIQDNDDNASFADDDFSPPYQTTTNFLSKKPSNNDDDSDQDWSKNARDTKLNHVREDEDDNLCCRVDEEINFDDPLIESVNSLKVFQEALQQEIEKFREIGNESFPSDDDGDSTKCRSEFAEASTVDQEFYESCISNHTGKQNSSSSLEQHVVSLTENINILEGKSEELQDVLTLKNSMIAELETALTCDEFLKQESTCTIGLLDEKLKEVESEFESLFWQKIEAEVEYLTITKMIHNLKVASAVRLLEKQDKMSATKVKTRHKLEVAGNEDSIMKSRADESEKYHGEILGIDKTFVIQRRLCKLTYCFLLQFMLLILVLWLVVSKLESNYEVYVPT